MFFGGLPKNDYLCRKYLNMIEITFGAFVVALLLVAIGKSKYAGIIFAVVFILFMIGLAKACDDEEKAKKEFQEKSDRWSNEIRKRKEYYNNKYGGVQWDSPANNVEKSEND